MFTEAMVIEKAMVTLDEFEKVFDLMRNIPEVKAFWMAHNLKYGDIFKNEQYQIIVEGGKTKVLVAGKSEGDSCKVYNADFDLMDA